MTRALPSKLLYDTTVYIDILQGRFPAHEKEFVLRACQTWHSPVALAELAAGCGLLDPDHPQTPAIVEQVQAVTERMPVHRTINPDSDTWQEAGMLSGVLTRLAGYAKGERRRALNDALIFATARKHGCVVLTRDIRDFDFLEQLDPYGRVLFYR